MVWGNRLEERTNGGLRMEVRQQNESLVLFVALHIRCASGPYERGSFLQRSPDFAFAFRTRLIVLHVHYTRADEHSEAYYKLLMALSLNKY